MVKLLAERYDMICCGENYHDVFPRKELSRWKQPGLCYFDTMSGWQEWLNMTPEEHWNWQRQVSDECAEIEILELIKLAASGRKVIVDTNIPPDVLRAISSYHRVAILLCDPPDICAARFFDRDDPDKKFMMDQIGKCPDPEAALKNFYAWARYRPPMRSIGSIPDSSHIPALILIPIHERKCCRFWQNTSIRKNKRPKSAPAKGALFMDMREDEYGGRRTFLLNLSAPARQAQGQIAKSRPQIRAATPHG